MATCSVKRLNSFTIKSSYPFKIKNFLTWPYADPLNSCTYCVQDAIITWLQYFMSIKIIKIAKYFTNSHKWFNVFITLCKKSGNVTVTYLLKNKTKNYKLQQIGQKESFYPNYSHKLMIIKKDKNSWPELKVQMITINLAY